MVVDSGWVATVESVSSSIYCYLYGTFPLINWRSLLMKFSYVIYQQARKGIYLFYNPPNNFSRRTHVDSSCIFGGFFRVSSYGIVNQPFNFTVTGFCRKFFFCFVFHDRLKFSLNACSFLGLSSVEIKSHDGYQIARRISSVIKN